MSRTSYDTASYWYAGTPGGVSDASHLKIFPQRAPLGRAPLPLGMPGYANTHSFGTSDGGTRKCPATMLPCSVVGSSG